MDIRNNSPHFRSKSPHQDQVRLIDFHIELRFFSIKGWISVAEIDAF